MLTGYLRPGRESHHSGTATGLPRALSKDEKNSEFKELRGASLVLRAVSFQAHSSTETLSLGFYFNCDGRAPEGLSLTSSVSQKEKLEGAQCLL